MISDNNLSISEIPPDLFEEVNTVSFELLPDKSREKYEYAYEQFYVNIDEPFRNLFSRTRIFWQQRPRTLGADFPSLDLHNTVFLRDGAVSFANAPEQRETD